MSAGPAALAGSCREHAAAVRARTGVRVPATEGRVCAARVDPPDDSALIAASLAEPELFAVLVRRHAPAIARYVTRRIGRDAAEDIVAETFLVAFRQRARYTDQGRDCLPWLYGIATRLAHRHWRTETRQLRLLARTGADPVTEPFADRVDAAVSAERGEAQARRGAGPPAQGAARRAAAARVGRPELRADRRGDRRAARHRPVPHQPGTAAPARRARPDRVAGEVLFRPAATHGELR